MNKTIKVLNNGDFKVISTTYDIPVKYVNTKLQSGVDNSRSRNNSKRRNKVFIEIIGADSVEHWYHGRIYSDGNWCYKHEQYEYVEAK